MPENPMLIRAATTDDVNAICSMRQAVLGWARREEYVATAVADGHAVVAYEDGVLVAFRYQHPLTPDTLGDGLLLVSLALRGSGLGRAVVHVFERTAPPTWLMSVVLNTDLLATTSPKGPATGFWVACGYQLLASTGNTRLLVKHLDPFCGDSDGNRPNSRFVSGPVGSLGSSHGQAVPTKAVTTLWKRNA